MMSNKTLLTVALMLAGLFEACKDDPVAPPANTVTIVGPKSSVVGQVDTFVASINFTSQAALYYRWTFDDTTFQTVPLDVPSKVGWKFTDTGLHVIRVHVLRTGDNTDLCSATDTISILDTVHHDTTPPPPHLDTTSHNFSWTEFTNVGSENNMTGCWVFGPNCIYANNGWMHRWDGSSWTTLHLYCPDPNVGNTINGSMSGMTIFGFDTNDYWLTGGSALFHYTGNGIGEAFPVYYLSHGRLNSSWGTSSSDLYAVGDKGAILHFDGTTWTRMATPTTKDLGNIWGTASNDVWAVGYNSSTGEAEVLHFDGSSWQEDELASAGTAKQYGVGCIYTCDSAGHKFVAATGSEVFRRRDNGPWVIDNSVPNGDHIGIGINGNAPNDLLVAGGWGIVAHWNGLNWKRYDQFYNLNDPAYGALAGSMKGNTVCIAGMKNGTSWVLIGQRQ